MEQKKKSLFGLNMWVVLFLGCLLVLGIFLYFRRKKAAENQSDEIEDEETETNEIDPDEIIAKHYNIISSALDAEGLTDDRLHRLVTAQAMHETGVFTSNIYRANNNMFGMNQPQKRPTTSQGKKNNFASYASHGDSAKDYAIYYKYVQLPETFASPDEFVKALKEKSYFEDNYLNYRNGVNAHYKKLNQILNNG